MKRPRRQVLVQLTFCAQVFTLENDENRVQECGTRLEMRAGLKKSAAAPEAVNKVRLSGTQSQIPADEHDVEVTSDHPL